MRARRVIAALAGLLWLAFTTLTVLIILGSGFDVLVLFALLISVLLGVTTLGLIREGP